ncbi:hypothetical protein HAV22_12795 [Massilia sp. TW-1]|uniref:Uncharacterized protein n=1 Tax=Telluria antibiotica TaxID=2717319 RepID=A0ABX0PD83_9BURK|nr:hypothetical protein [Telluria antibiotica]NIA54513.1 hypothetical protein [Telluria antibiotica]
MNHVRSRACAALILTLAAPLAPAMTAVERQVDAASAPHSALGRTAKPITVHYVHRKDEYANSPRFRSLRETIKHAVAVCVEGNRRLGRPAHPPAAFPDQTLRVNNFDYSAPNRNIVYSVSYDVQMAEDCSLIESERRGAVLTSTKGECRIDLVAKKAEGECDATGHANAAPRPRAPTRAQYDATTAALAADPRLAERMNAVRQLTGLAPGAAAAAERQTIAGHVCEVVQPTPGGAGACVSKEGSFIPAAGTEGVVLMEIFGKDKIKAVDAKFDMPVDPAIFTPYLSGGYTITSGRDQ